ncbi:hypothetical protein D3C81_1583060 [compost metagenome]
MRVVLRQGEQLAEAGSQPAFGTSEGADIATLAGAGHGVARGDHLFQGLALVLHVLLAGFHQLGQLVMALLEQHVDVRPGLADPMLEPHQAVVEHHQVAGQQNPYHPQRNHEKTHRCSP